MSETLEYMRIGELARRAGVSHRTIHYYEAEGLLSPTERATSGHRYYRRIKQWTFYQRDEAHIQEIKDALARQL